MRGSSTQTPGRPADGERRPSALPFAKAFALRADKNLMERRDDPRLPTELSGSVTRLGGPEERLSIWIEDVSEGGIRFVATEALECGSFLVINVEESTLFGQVRYCQGGNSSYTVGVLVERMLMGGSNLSMLLENLLTAA